MQSQESGHILIVDDSRTNVAVLHEFLTSAGFAVETAADGLSAIAQIEQKLPTLVLLDVIMPGIDGFETCQRLKSNPTTSPVPVIFMTSLSDTENRLKGLRSGAVDYIIKPFQREEMLARVNIHLQLQRLTQTLAEQNIHLKQWNEKLEQRVEERTAKLSQSLQQLQQAQVQLVQNEKMSALGQLVAGVAHEINNPVGSLSANLEHVETYAQDLSSMVQLYQKHYPQPDPEILEEQEAVDLGFVLGDLPKIFKSMKLASERLRNISGSLRTFSRSETASKVPADIHSNLDSTLLILKHRLKANGDRPVIEIIKKYGDLPLVDCYPGQLNQVFMNLLANAIDALEEENESEVDSGPSLFSLFSVPQIRICTELVEPDWIAIRIADNGPGLTKDATQRLFEPMFTTKPPGKGTGLGLSISHQIITEHHGGRLQCQSVQGQGTEFAIEIPVRSRENGNSIS